MANGLVAPAGEGHGLYEGVCPVSHQAASSSMTCPMSIPNGSSPKTSSLLARSFSKSPPLSGIDEDTGCPLGLADTSADKNPLFDEFDNDAIYTNLRERVRYLTQFVNFTEDDVEALNDFQPILLPLVDQLVDNVYHHLFRFDITKQVFMPRKNGQEGRMLSDLRDLALDAPQIEMRKRTFAVYMRKLVTSDYDDFATWQYFDHIGIMHTGQDELKHRKLMGKAPLYVDLMHLSLLLGWTLDVLTPVILSYPEYPLARRIEIMRAFQKVIWIQNDLFTRHYAVRSTEVAGLKALRDSVNLSSQEDVQSELKSIKTFQTSSTHSGSESSVPPVPQRSYGPGPSNRHTYAPSAPSTHASFSSPSSSGYGPNAGIQNFPSAKEIKEKKGWFSFGR
ncbi:hypothetical protein CC1G_06219 [Coprinopsis cinerea okayama7|uniref:Globin-sensor domain-containing protein n=1 Tax=Coprinopsis cinerea (strain Okayama-7 / 130 / ATCC MYA-4618 / FGSC 9003) TaxID=240176 RepID=A8NV97_COPC7|nr:hypothetical protein CC1G_06219 [Coprinopsis cinerea okayama7\|eukprot:XP_001836632.1 hypothetical protein CC1G_06219 [Coprinopsis cinerea okayama7\